MIKRLFLLISLFLCISLPTAHAEKWIPITSSTLSSVLFIDADQIEVEGDTATIRVKEVYKGGRYEIMKHRLHKKARTFDDLSIAIYKPDGEMISESNLDDPKYKNQAIVPNQISDAMYHLIWTSPKENWVHLKDTNNGTRKVYIDTNSIDRGKVVSSAWLKSETAERTVYLEFLFLKDSRTTILGHYHLYVQGKLSEAGIAPLKQIPLTPGSAIEKAFYIVWPNEK